MKNSLELLQVYQCFCDETRLRILNLLSSGSLCVCHFQDILKLPQVKISKHLAYLREFGLVDARRDQNWMVYSLPQNPSPELRYNLKCLQDCVQTHPLFSQDRVRLRALLPEMRVPASDTGHTFDAAQPYKILFLCTGNSARSIMAEFLMRKIAMDRFQAFSAGSNPQKTVNRLALKVLHDVHHIDAKEARSKSWKEFRSRKFDFVITLCDKALQSCPSWAGQPIAAHWGFDDPAAFPGEEPEKYRVFIETSKRIAALLRRFASLPIEKLDELRLEHATRALGHDAKCFTITGPTGKKH